MSLRKSSSTDKLITTTDVDWFDYSSKEDKGSGYHSDYEDKQGKHLKNYTNMLGKGTYGTVFEFNHSKTSAKTAVKTIKIRHNQTKKKFRKVIQNEVLITRKFLGDCRYKINKKGNLAWVVMPYLQGVTLHKFLGTTDDLKVIIPVLISALKSLAHIHKHGFVHCDPSVTNIMVDGSNARIFDFGFARKIGRPTWKIKNDRYAPEIAAPETLAEVSQDSYSMGHLFKQMGSEKKLDVLQEIGDEMTQIDPKKRLSVPQAIQRLQDELVIMPIMNALNRYDLETVSQLFSQITDRENSLNLLLLKLAQQERFYEMNLIIQKNNGSLDASYKATNQSLKSILQNHFAVYIAEGKHQNLDSLFSLPLPTKPVRFADMAIDDILKQRGIIYYIKHQNLLKTYLSSQKYKEIARRFNEDKDVYPALANEIKFALQKKLPAEVLRLIRFLNDEALNKITKLEDKKICFALYEANKKGLLKNDLKNIYQIIYAYEHQSIFADQDIRQAILDYKIPDSKWLKTHETQLKLLKEEDTFLEELNSISINYPDMKIQQIKKFVENRELTSALRKTLLQLLHNPQIIDKLNFFSYLEILSGLDKKRECKEIPLAILEVLNIVNDRITNIDQLTFNLLYQLCQDYRHYSPFIAYLKKIVRREFFLASEEEGKDFLKILDKLVSPFVTEQDAKKVLSYKLEIEAILKKASIYNDIKKVTMGKESTQTLRYPLDALYEACLYRLFYLLKNINLYPTTFKDEVETVLDNMKYFLLLDDSPNNIKTLFLCVEKNCPVDRQAETVEQIRGYLEKFKIEIPKEILAHQASPKETKDEPLVELSPTPPEVDVIEKKVELPPVLEKPKLEAKSSAVVKPTLATLLADIKKANARHPNAFISLKPITDIIRVKFNTFREAEKFASICRDSKATSQMRQGNLIFTHPEEENSYVIYLSNADKTKILEKTGTTDWSSILSKNKGTEDPFISYMLIVDSDKRAIEFMDRYGVEYTHSLADKGKNIEKSIIRIPSSSFLRRDVYGIYLAPDDLDSIQTELLQQKVESAGEKVSLKK